MASTSIGIATVLASAVQFLPSAEILNSVTHAQYRFSSDPNLKIELHASEICIEIAAIS